MDTPGEDPEVVALAAAVKHKLDAIAALALVAEARKARGIDTIGLEDSLEYERVTAAGYEKALDYRRRELAGRGRR